MSGVKFHIHILMALSIALTLIGCDKNFNNKGLQNKTKVDSSGEIQINTKDDLIQFLSAPNCFKESVAALRAVLPRESGHFVKDVCEFENGQKVVMDLENTNIYARLLNFSLFDGDHKLVLKSKFTSEYGVNVDLIWKKSRLLSVKSTSDYKNIITCLNGQKVIVAPTVDSVQYYNVILPRKNEKDGMGVGFYGLGEKFLMYSCY